MRPLYMPASQHKRVVLEHVRLLIFWKDINVGSFDV